MANEELVRLAIEAMAFAYTPYSGFRVGAALLTAEGKVYQGCNIENAAYTPTNCAERTAFFKAVSEGQREFDAICIVGGKDGILSGYTAPCGVCRQVLEEFATEIEVILVNREGKTLELTLPELLPYGFGPKDLER